MEKKASIQITTSKLLSQKIINGNRNRNDKSRNRDNGNRSEIETMETEVTSTEALNIAINESDTRS